MIENFAIHFSARDRAFKTATAAFVSSAILFPVIRVYFAELFVNDPHHFLSIFIRYFFL